MAHPKKSCLSDEALEEALHALYRKPAAPCFVFKREERPAPVRTRSGARRWTVPVCAAAAAAAVLVVAVPPLFRNPPPGGASSSAPPASSDNVSVIGQIPKWYSPGALTISALDYKEGFNGFVGTRYLDLTDRYTQPGHESCTGVYYDLRDNTVICLSHQIREALIAGGLADEKTAIGVHFYEPGLGKVLFTAGSKKTGKSYCYDMAEKTLLPLDISLYNSVYHTGGPGERLSGEPYYVVQTPRPNGNLDDVFLLDLNTGKSLNLLKTNGKYDRDAMDDARLSPGGHYVFYTKMTGDGERDNGPARTTAIYSVETGKTAEFQGQILHALPDDSRLVVRRPDGVYVYTCATGQSVPLAEAADLPAQYGFILTTGDAPVYAAFDECKSLAIMDLRTGEKTPVSESYIFASAVSPDYRFLYTYVRGENVVGCREIATGNTFSVPVDASLTAITEGEARDKRVVFEACFDETTDTLLLGYSLTDSPRVDPEQYCREQEADPRNQIKKWMSKGMTSIGDFADMMERYPGEFDVYQGDGFTYLGYNRLLGPNHSLSVAVEDYRTNRFYTVYHDGMDFGSIFTVSQDTAALPAGRREATAELITRLGMAAQNPPLDYADYIKDGKIDVLKMLENATRPERLMALTDCYFVKTMTCADSAHGLQGEDDLRELRSFLEFASEQNWQYKKLDNGNSGFSGKNAFYIELYNSQPGTIAPWIYVGTRDKKPYIQFGEREAPLSQEDFDRWCAWLDKKSRKCLARS